MALSECTQAILLLTVRFPGSEHERARPLSPTEWGRFAAWLKERSLAPEDLFEGPSHRLLQHWTDNKVTHERVEALLKRGHALALAADRWQAAGLWIVTRSDPDYPARLKQKLGRTSPAVLFGSGNRELLSGGGLGVVGSRKAPDADLEYARSVGCIAAGQGHTLISGAARGIDMAAMLGALESEGTVVGVLADGLLRKCMSAAFRPYLASNDLALFSTVHPEAPFHAGSAMHRNRYIYCLSDATMVVHSGRKGGTWSGAVENLNHSWTRLWVKVQADSRTGNAELIRKGAAPITVDADQVRVCRLFDSVESPSLFPSTSPEPEPPARPTAEDPGARQHRQEEVLERPRRQSRTSVTTDPPQSSAPAGSKGIGTSRGMAIPLSKGNAESDIKEAFYGLFLQAFQLASSAEPVTPQPLADSLGLELRQIKSWLARASAEGRIKKLQRPVRYEWDPRAQGTLFREEIPDSAGK